MKLVIKPIMDKKGITRFELSKRIGMTYPSVDKMYKSQTTSIRFSTLEVLCKVLSCTPNDILIFDDESKKRKGKGG